MGRQIAARMAQHGVYVWLFDRNRAVCVQSLQWMRSIVNDHIESSSSAVIEDWLPKVQIADELFVPEMDLVIESVPEQISLNQRSLLDADHHHFKQLLLYTDHAQSICYRT